MSDRLITPAYRVDTPRLLICCWEPQQAFVLREALDESYDHMRPWIPFMKDEPRSVDATLQWLREVRASFDRDQAYHYAVLERESGRLVGGNMLHPRVGGEGLELGYWTRLTEVGKGYALEATCAMIRVAFTVHRAGRTEIQCYPENQASAAIPARLGFRHEVTLRKRTRDSTGAVRDLMVWTLLAEEFAGSPAFDLDLRAFDCAGRLLETAIERGADVEAG